MSWVSLWAVVFFGALAAFAVISALIAVMGLGEIRALFAHLAAGREQDGSGR
ncbi:MAG: hypothetical protein ACM3PV_11960 [Betaproteobacteria bacterium]